MPAPPLEVDCRAVKSLLDSGQDFMLLDCRQPEEHAIVSIPQAKLIPMHDLPGQISDLEPFRDRQVIVHCHHGGRSLQVASWLRRQGFSQAASMAGGIDQWAIEIDPSLPRY